MPGIKCVELEIVILFIFWHFFHIFGVILSKLMGGIYINNMIKTEIDVKNNKNIRKLELLENKIDDKNLMNIK